MKLCEQKSGYISVVKYISCFLFSLFAQTTKIFLQRKFPDLRYNYRTRTNYHNHNNLIQLIVVSVSSGPPQSQTCWLITQWVITMTNSTLLCWLRSACCRCLFYVQVRFTIAPLSPFSSHLLVLALKVLATPQVGLISPWYPQDPHLDREVPSST